MNHRSFLDSLSIGKPQVKQIDLLMILPDSSITAIYLSGSGRLSLENQLNDRRTRVSMAESTGLIPILNSRKSRK